jgi:hypothetical protein
MSTITSLQALDFERRLNTLENNVGITIARKRNNQNSKTSNSNDSIDDRLAKIKRDLEGKIASAASEATTSSSNTNTNTSTTKTSFSSSQYQQQRQQQQQSWKEIQKLLKELDPGIALTHQQQPLLYKRQQVLAVSDELTKDFGELDTILKLLLSGTKVDGAAAAEEGADNENPSTPKGKQQGITSTKKGQSSSSSPQKSKQQQQQQQAKKDLEIKKQQHQQQQQSDATTQRSSSSGGQITLRLDQVLQAPILTPSRISAQPAEQKRVEDLRQTFLELNERTKKLHATLRHFLECYHVATMAVSEKIILADERISSAAAAKQNN